jgi:hypothetical protein
MLQTLSYEIAINESKLYSLKRELAGYAYLKNNLGRVDVVERFAQSYPFSPQK